MPQTTLKNAIAYEEWLAQADGDFAWKDFDENTAAAMCYTSGPTVWLMLLQHMTANNLKLPNLEFVVCGGSAMPRSMIKAFIDMGVTVRHAWGMTEMSPLGTLAALKPPFTESAGDAQLDIL